MTAYIIHHISTDELSALSVAEDKTRRNVEIQHAWRPLYHTIINLYHEDCLVFQHK